MKIKLFCFVASLLGSMISSAAVFNVNNFDDLVDINPGDGICEATTSVGNCTLRAAIIESNSLAGSDTIELPAGTFTLSIVGNDDAATMGDLDLTFADLILSGAGMDVTVINGGGIDRIFHINQSHITIQDLTLQNGGDSSATVSGGAMEFAGGTSDLLTINRVKFDNNRANSAAGLYLVGSSNNRVQAVITNSIFVNNSTVDLGVTNQFGPAIFCNRCDVLVNSITVSHSGSGQKAIRVEAGSLEMLNSTISNNQEGGIRSTNADVLIKFSTFFENGGQDLSFFSFDGSHSFEIGYSVLQTSTTDNCQSGDLPISLGYNVTSDSSCNFTMTGDSQATDAQCGLLTDNGGTTQTHLPAMTSPLINQVPLSECLDIMGAALTLDQRGFKRPSDLLCDIGSIEVNNDLIFSNGFE